MVSVVPCAERFGKTTWCLHKLWCLTIEQWFTIMKKEQLTAVCQKPTCVPSMSRPPGEHQSIKIWLSSTVATSEPEVTHCCFTWSRLHKLLTVITLNSFNGKSNSEMSWTRLSLTDLWAHCVLTWATNQISFPSIFLQKYLLDFARKQFTRLLESASED